MSTWALAALGVTAIAGVVIAVGFALDDPAVQNALEREGAALRRGWDRLAAATAPARKWAADETRPARAALADVSAPAVAWVLALVSIVVYGFTTMRHAYRAREGRHYADAVHRAHQTVRESTMDVGRHRAVYA